MRTATRTITSLLLGAVLAVSGGACGAGGTDSPGGGGGTTDGLSGLISQDATLTGDVHISGDLTVGAGVTLTISAGAAVSVADGKQITVQGTLLVDGTADATVSLLPDDGAASWRGITVAPGGAATLRYATGTQVATLLTCEAGAVTCELERDTFDGVGDVLANHATAEIKESQFSDMAGGGVYMDAGSLHIVDSSIQTSSGDIIVISGGNLAVEYSSVGGSDYEHCNFHINRADSLSITHSDVSNGVYGIMIGTVDGADLEYDNWEGNGTGTDVEEIGTTTSADFSHGFWSQGAPTNLGDEFDVSAPADVHIDDAGPRI